MKPGKLILKFISLFKILEYISEFIYKLKLLNLYNKLYLTFYISFFKEYIIKKSQGLNLYSIKEFPEFVNNNKKQE